MSSVTVRCTKCGILGFFNNDAPHKVVNKLVFKHKPTGHRIKVKRLD